jgi:plasmid stability protein
VQPDSKPIAIEMPPKWSHFTTVPAITLKNLPENLHALLKLRARRHHRSLTGEFIAVLHEAIEKDTSVQSDVVAQQRALSHRRPLPSFHSGVEVSADFDLVTAIRTENAAADDTRFRPLPAGIAVAQPD